MYLRLNPRCGHRSHDANLFRLYSLFPIFVGFSQLKKETLQNFLYCQRMFCLFRNCLLSFPKAVLEQEVTVLCQADNNKPRLTVLEWLVLDVCGTYILEYIQRHNPQSLNIYFFFLFFLTFCLSFHHDNLLASFTLTLCSLRHVSVTSPGPGE